MPSISKNPREDIAYQVRGTFRAFENALISALAEKELPLGSFHILLINWPENGLTQKEIAKLTFVTASVASQQIKKMCKAGLLKRENDKQDIRKKIVKLTEEGQIIRKHLVLPILSIPKAASVTMSDDEIQTTLKVLKELRENLKLIDPNNG